MGLKLASLVVRALVLNWDYRPTVKAVTQKLNEWNFPHKLLLVKRWITLKTWNYDKHNPIADIFVCLSVSCFFSGKGSRLFGSWSARWGSLVQSNSSFTYHFISVQTCAQYNSLTILTLTGTIAWFEKEFDETPYIPPCQLETLRLPSTTQPMSRSNRE